MVAEKNVTKEVRTMLKQAGIFHWKNWSGPMTSPKGIADILGVIPVPVSKLVEMDVSVAGMFFALELKATGGKPNDDQYKFLRKVRNSHGIAMWADDPATVRKNLTAWTNLVQTLF